MLLNVAVAMTGLAGIVIAFRARIYGTTVQDRVIRLEMQLRLKEILPDDLKGRIGELSKSQLVGLRFGSDAEIPELTAKVLDQNIQKSSDIKKLVTDWQADHLRV